MLSKLRVLNRACMVKSAMPMASIRSFRTELGLDSDSLANVAEADQHSAVELWKAQVEANKNSLVLKTNDEIEQYVLSIVKDYFLCTKKASVTLDCMLSDHGLDSLDAIELVIKIEDELGYVIDAENLEKFKKPIHYVNFIKHMEAYKEEHSKLPHEDTKATMYTMEEAFPGVPVPKMGK